MSYPFIEHTMDQRSEAWFKVRLGKVTSSRATPMLSAVKKGEAASGLASASSSLRRTKGPSTSKANWVRGPNSKSAFQNVVYINLRKHDHYQIMGLSNYIWVRIVGSSRDS